MDLRSWITAEHHLVGERLQQQVLEHVPVERHGEHADDGGSSITFLLWHLARHQDVSINAVVRGADQVLAARRSALGAEGIDAGAGLAEAEDRVLTRALDPHAVIDYHAAVAAETGRWLEGLDLAELDTVPDASARLADADVLQAEFPWLHRMWEGQPVSFHVMWEVVGHGVTHVGEMVSIRNRLGLSPF